MVLSFDIIYNAFLGAAVGDAIGVPYQFTPRQKMAENPCIGMTGKYNIPKGTYSDDTCLLLATADGLCDGNIVKKYQDWLFHGRYTPDGKTFDVGKTTMLAIAKSKITKKSGLSGKRDNGNGSLMRILPLAFYLIDEEDIEKRRKLVYDVSAITHAHIISMEGCFLYVEMARCMLKGESPIDSYHHTCKTAVEAYKRYSEGNINELNEDGISSSGYVADTLETAVWCLLTTESYKECILKAVNLGGDTDTIACVAGGLAGIIYDVPLGWKLALKNKTLIKEISEKLYQKITMEMIS